MAEAAEWAAQYADLTKRLENESKTRDLSKKASEFLRAGDLGNVAAQLDEELRTDELGKDQSAEDNYNRGQVFELQFQNARADEFFQKAHASRPNDPQYALAFATSLATGDQLPRAAEIDEQALKRPSRNKVRRCVLPTIRSCKESNYIGRSLRQNRKNE